ncbi:hypothetical protein WISP_99877 [Willisornis vidua]|uniref:Uncharacterized protein n=1 Tax=Willisornis vidua TaxID=1566151 RepID=A0ABQ9D3W0_9PASS|nr:hypothetical protein WISP_99877 [Willisornis vidua]
MKYLRVNKDFQDSSTPPFPGGENGRCLGSSPSLNFTSGTASPCLSLAQRLGPLATSNKWIHFSPRLHQALEEWITFATWFVPDHLGLEDLNNGTQTLQAKDNFISITEPYN